MDTNAEALSEVSWRAGRRETRGGVRNLLSVAASALELSRELPAVADRLTVVLPWGELLRAVAVPEPASLLAIAALCQPGADIEIVFSHDRRRDSAASALPSFYALDACEVRDRLEAHYRRAGIHVQEVEKLDRRALLDFPSTWAKRLAHGRERSVWRIRGRKDSGAR